MKYGIDIIHHMGTGKIEYGVVHQSTGRIVVKASSESAMVRKMHQMNA